MIPKAGHNFTGSQQSAIFLVKRDGCPAVHCEFHAEDKAKFASSFL
eukprot:CAMPEP_0180246812 /NCGR_PEP_ID=MMETSP0987-20121128/35782_1 /TAXON_ID=697907 /ORGANISM="non described non described, Strain CCMP2293" /LENGTH=45 /DNA_ID= /DNA_START= /DNA_END= /DNA_ORIENTATION=